MRFLFCRFVQILPLFVLWGCSAGHYQKQADKDVYEILKQVEKDIFGQSSDFSIETEGSGVKPGERTSAKVLQSRSGEKKLTLSLDEALSYAVKNSREYQSQKERLYLTALTLTGARHNFRPSFFGNTRGDYTRLSDGELQGSVDTNLGVNQALTTGATLGVNIANDLLRYFSGDPRRSAASVLSLNVTQPLLRGAGRKIAAENLTQANRNVVYAIRDYAHFQNTFSVDVVFEYFDLLQRKDVVFNEYSNYLSRKSNVEYLTARAVDRESKESVGNAEQDELVAKNRYISSITSYHNALDRFKITLGLPQQTELRLDDREIDKLRKMGANSMSLASEQAFAIAVKHRLPLFNQIDRFEDNKRQIAIAANQLKADLNIIGSASLSNNGGVTDYNNFNFKDVRSSVGLQLNLPLDRLRERNEYRATLINFESATRSLGLNFDELRNLLDRQLRELQQFRQTYEIQKKAVEVARSRVKGNKARFEKGLVIFRRLSESQDALIAAQNAETRSIVDYLRARLGLLVDLGVLDTGKKNYWLKNNPSKLKSFDRKIQGSVPADSDAEVIPPEKLFQ